MLKYDVSVLKSASAFLQSAWKLPLEELDLPGRIHNLLLDNEIETVGDVLLNLEVDDQIFLGYRGFGDKMLETLKEYVAVYQLTGRCI